MKGMLTANRVIVAHLLAAYEQSTFDRANTSLGRANIGASSQRQQRLSLLRRHVSARGVRRYATIVVAIAGVVAGNFSLITALAVCTIGALGLLAYARIKEAKRITAIERDLPALLTSVASSVRAGIDPIRAIADAARYFPAESPFVSEIRLFSQRLAQGADECEAIEQLLAGDNNVDVELFKRCILLSRRHGSSLADPLHRVVRVVRQRQSFKRKTRAALAMHRMSALGIALCAILIAVMQLAMNSKGVALAFERTAGRVLLSVGGVLISAGVGWMLCMGKEEKF